MSGVLTRSNALERISPVFLPYGLRRNALVPATGKALAEACGVYDKNYDWLSLPEYYCASQDGAKVLSKCSQEDNQNHPLIVCAAIYGTCEDYERVSQEWFSDQDDVRSCRIRVHRFHFVMKQYFRLYVDWEHAIEEDSGDAVFGAMAEAVKTLILSPVDIPPYEPSLSTGSYILIGLYGNCLLKDYGDLGLRFVAENIDGFDDYFQISIVTNERHKNVLAWFRFQEQFQEYSKETVINLTETETDASWGGLGMNSCLFSLILHFWQCCKTGVDRVQITAASPVMLYTSAIFGFCFRDLSIDFTHFKNAVVPWLLGDADMSKKTSDERYPNILSFELWNKYATCWADGVCGRMTENRGKIMHNLCDNYDSYCHVMSLNNTPDILDFELETQKRMKKMVERYSQKKKTIGGSGPAAPPIERHPGTAPLWAAVGAAVTVLCSLVGSCPDFQRTPRPDA